jgi:hypothetical protein
MPMTHAEHAQRIHRSLTAVHKALRHHHAALAAYAAEHGPGLSIGDELIELAVVPKDEPRGGG